MKETKTQKKARLRRAVIIRHRRNKSLCEQCGMDPHEGECEEIYTKADMRDIPQQPKKIDLKKKKDTILAYRKKKLLCLNCGRERHNEDCNENWDQADNRTEEEKKRRPAVVKTPKAKPETILETLKTDNVEREVTIKLKPTKIIKLQRPFVSINLQKSSGGDIVELSCISQISRKFRDYIVCVIGSFESNFPCSDLLKLRKMPSIYELKTGDLQMIVNYLASSEKFFSFNCDLTDYCKKYKFHHYVFEEGKNATHFMKDIAYQL
jgi:hypothetical protein